MADSRRGGHHGTSGRQFNDDTYNAFERALGFAAGNDPPLVGHATNESAAADVSTGALLPPPSIRARSASLGSRRANTYIAADGSTGALIPPPSHRPRTMSLSSRRANFTPLPGTNLFLLFLYAFFSIGFLIREGKSHICQDVSPRTRGRIVRRSQLRRRQQHVHAPVRHRWHRVALLKEGHRYKFFFFCFLCFFFNLLSHQGLCSPCPWNLWLAPPAQATTRPWCMAVTNATTCPWCRPTKTFPCYHPTPTRVTCTPPLAVFPQMDLPLMLGTSLPGKLTWSQHSTLSGPSTSRMTSPPRPRPPRPPRGDPVTLLGGTVRFPFYSSAAFPSICFH